MFADDADYTAHIDKHNPRLAPYAMHIIFILVHITTCSIKHPKPVYVKHKICSSHMFL